MHLPNAILDVCVSTTARQAAERGYDVLLAKEAIGGECSSKVHHLADGQKLTRRCQTAISQAQRRQMWWI